jgi:hypothetical protein
MRGRQSADDDPTQFGRLVVSNLTTVEVKAFVPARDFALSKQFYQDLGFELAWSDDDLAYMRHGNSSFLLQNFYNEVHAGNFMMHLLVTDVDVVGLRMQNCEIKYKKPTAGAGAQKSGNFRRRPRGYLARIPAEFRKLFLSSHAHAFDRDRAAPAAPRASRVLPPAKSVGREATRAVREKLALTL